jgi:hypothetical protein
LAALRIDLVGTTADFRRFSPLHPLPINHLSCENSEMQGRIGEVRLALDRPLDWFPYGQPLVVASRASNQLGGGFKLGVGAIPADQH